MKQQKQDRRSLRTRQLVSDAMMQLMREKRYSSITVQDLLDRAGIGRSTFYAHYFDKDDALAALVEQMLTGFSERINRSEAGQAIIPSLELFRHAAENRVFFQATILSHVSERMWEMSHTLLSRNIEQTLMAASPVGADPTMPPAVVAQYLAGAFLRLFIWWLETEAPYTPEQMDSMFQRLAMPGVWSVIESGPR